MVMLIFMLTGIRQIFPTWFDYSMASSLPYYTDVPTAHIDVDRLIQEKLYWREFM